MIRSATAIWHGTGKEGTGNVSSLSGAIANLPYSWTTRFGDETGKSGTNPEELIASAHASCFTMAVAFQVSGAGMKPEELKTEAVLTIEPVNGANTITKILLKLQAKVPGMADAQFQELATKAKETCPVSRVLKAEISLEAKLV